MERYTGARPSPGYASARLRDRHFIMLAAMLGETTVIGALTAYVLPKYEREVSEIYIYDIAVAAPWRRRGVATALIDALKPIARDCGAETIFVQADHDDPPAIALYEKLGRREEVFHFDIDPA